MRYALQGAGLNDVDLPSVEASTKRGNFFGYIFGGLTGYLCIAAKTAEGRFNEYYYEYPNEISAALAKINALIPLHNIYYCAHLLDKPSRRKENASMVLAAWADLDTCPPEKLLVPATLVVESSPGKYQGLWLLDDPIPAIHAEQISRRIAYYHKEDGADTSGWDVTQLLRVPLTQNFKYTFPYPTIKLIGHNSARYRLDDFDKYPQLRDEIAPGEAVPIEPHTTGATLLAELGKTLPDAVWKLFHAVPESHRWSDDLAHLIWMLTEAGLTESDIFWIVREASCNKFERDNRGDAPLWHEVRKARSKFDKRMSAVVVTTEKAKLLTDVEVEQDSFISRYITWAKGQTDAAEVYHQASAFMILSAALAGSVRLPTSYNPRGMPLNLWFMILGDTTLTRKSTAMEMGIDLLGEVTQDAVVATDATIEGLFATLAARSGKPSIFLRDEFSGMLEQMQKKDYYAGMAETLTKLYDGRTLQRQLARASITVRDPLLVMFTGGIRSRVLELMNEGYISSGFIPRFLFFSAASDVSRLRPLGPPTQATDDERVRLVHELQGIVDRYDQLDTFQVGASTTTSKRIFYAELSNDAWKRYNAIESQLLHEGTSAREPELYTPVYQRLGVSILKASVLLACTRSGNPHSTSMVTVDVGDIEQAASFGNSWRNAAVDVVSSAGRDAFEVTIRRVYEFCAMRPNGTSRAIIMRKWKLDARGADNLLNTMEQRSLLRKIKQDGNYLYLALGD